MPKFAITYRITGVFSETVEAESLKAAEKIAIDQIPAEGFDVCLDEVDSAEVSVREMHSVVRDGKPLWTTHPLDSDERVADA